MDKIFDGYLMVSDMDGTLLNSEKKISKGNLEAIKYFVDNGGKFTVATGRMVQSVGNFVDEIRIKLPTILHNGAKIYDFMEDKIIAEHSIEEHRKEVIKKVKRDYPNIGIEVFADEIVYIYQRCELTKRYNKYNYNIVYDLPNEVWDKPWVKVLLIGDEKDLDKLEIEYKEHYDNGNAFRSGANYFDIVANGISKGIALEELIERYNFDKTKVIAVGDNMNDIEMLEVAEYGFYIEGGAKRGLERAKLIAPSNDNNPIKYIIGWLENKIIKVKRS
ncbi:Cof-type HAD-IIB family hydrolase [Clostridium sp. LP20]|uniref:Cof-type HAD-IIB family hydrolase n=1 Tax=Clostridium sp. LP20 TaxID=3418665 RepID=UPI003EE429C1